MKESPQFHEPLPADLAALDAELSAIRYEERPSFGPELQAELSREWAGLQGRRYWPVRRLMAASVAALLMVGLGVPSARAAIVRFVGSFHWPTQEQPEPPDPTPLALPFVAPAQVSGADDPVVNELPLVVPPMAPAEEEVLSGVDATFPELLDRPLVEDVIRRNYPLSFQRAGIGGTVRLLLWVDSTGAVDFANIGRSSGIPELDRAAIQVSPSFRFEPARRRGRVVGTWVEFDVRFQPSPSTGGDPLPEVEPLEEPITPDEGAFSLAPDWGKGLPPDRGVDGAQELLEQALGRETVRALGSAEGILQGEPPAGVAPSAWREEASRALEAAVAAEPDNPAPFLALARIRQKQGLRTESRVLLERGLQRAQRVPGAVPPAILAELHYERGLLVKEGWMGGRGLGRLRADALTAAPCPQARSSGTASTGFASVDRLIAWNYLCPENLGQLFASDFELQDKNAEADRAVALASFSSAVTAEPAHHGANVELLLALADEGRWPEVLASASRFLRASGGDPYGRLLTGLALQRLSRSEEAEEFFHSALDVLPEQDRSQVEGLSPILVGPQALEYDALSRTDRARWAETYWAPLDPILATAVNEREVEHLARTTYALLRFGTVQSDAGEVWVRYGRPDEVRAVSDGEGVRTEFWDFGPGPDLTFRRLPYAQDVSLTPEGRSYLDEVRHVVPHRYGNDSRVVFGLPAQVSRFRSSGAQAEDVSVNAHVPGMLATGGRDSLALSLAVLGPEGDTLASSLRWIPAQERDVALNVSVSEPSTDVVVEFYSPRSGQAAALRRALPHRVEGARLAMSDLILTAPASPRREDVSRTGSWMEPLTLYRPVASHAIGIYVELYGLAEVAAWYRLRVEIQDRETGEIRDLPIQPAGESGFRGTWDRRPAEGERTSEFVSVWLSEVPSGRYVLRLVADVPDAGAPLIAEQEMDRR